MQEETRKVSKINYQSITVIFLVIVGIGIIVLLQSRKSFIDMAGKPRFEKGVQAPNFTLPDLNGKMISLADFKGQVVLLNIWATWCAPCVEEMPSMEKLHQELKDEKFALLAVSIDESGAEAVLPFMQRHKLTFRALIDRAGTINSLFQTTGVPESFVIDKNGNIMEEIIGPRDWASADAIRYFRSLIRSN